MMDLEKRSIIRLNDEIKNVYEPEEVRVFEEEILEKLFIPESFVNEFHILLEEKILI